MKGTFSVAFHNNGSVDLDIRRGKTNNHRILFDYDPKYEVPKSRPLSNTDIRPAHLAGRPPLPQNNSRNKYTHTMSLPMI